MPKSSPRVDNPHLRSWFERLGYRIVRRVAQVGFLLMYRIRAYGRENFPKTGGAIVCSNHQSHLDPVLIGHMCPRRMNYLARKSLFKFKPFAKLIDFLDAIPLEKDGMGIAGIKETMKRLKRDELVLIFPEGTRSPDGELKKFHAGFIVIARRTKSPLIPVGFDGAFRAWPRNRNYPLPGKIVVSVGKPIEFDEYKELDDDEVIRLLRDRIESEFNRARAAIGYRFAGGNAASKPPQDTAVQANVDQ